MMVPEHIATVYPARLVPAPEFTPPGAGAGQVRRWQASLFGPAWLAFVIVAAAVLEWFLVTERMSYSSAGLERAWKGVSLAMASFALLSLWCVHYLDPGVIPPNPRQDEDVRWYLSQNRPVVDVRFSEGGRELVKRFAKDFRGQTIKTIIPAELIDPENPENPALTTGAIPEFSEHCWTYRYCVTCNIWRPPRVALRRVRPLHGALRSPLPRRGHVRRAAQLPMVRLPPLRRRLRVRRLRRRRRRSSRAGVFVLARRRRAMRRGMGTVVRVCVWVFSGVGRRRAHAERGDVRREHRDGLDHEGTVGKKAAGIRTGAGEESRRALERHGQGRVRRRVLRAGAHASHQRVRARHARGIERRVASARASRVNDRKGGTPRRRA